MICQNIEQCIKYIGDDNNENCNRRDGVCRAVNRYITFTTQSSNRCGHCAREGGTN